MLLRLLLWIKLCLLGILLILLNEFQRVQCMQIVLSELIQAAFEMHWFSGGGVVGRKIVLDGFISSKFEIHQNLQHLGDTLLN